MGNVSLKVLEKSLNFLFKNGYEPCVNCLACTVVAHGRLLSTSLLRAQSLPLGILIKIAPRAFSFFLTSLPTTQRGFCEGERPSTKEA